MLRKLTSEGAMAVQGWCYLCAFSDLPIIVYEKVTSVPHLSRRNQRYKGDKNKKKTKI
jgi:hypothetical protein